MTDRTDPDAALAAPPEPVDRVLTALERILADARRCRDTQRQILAGYEKDVQLLEQLIGDHARRMPPKQRTSGIDLADAPPVMRAASESVNGLQAAPHSEFVGQQVSLTRLRGEHIAGELTYATAELVGVRLPDRNMRDVRQDDIKELVPATPPATVLEPGTNGGSES